MTKIQIVIHNPHKSIVRYAYNERDINEAVYSVLTKYGIDIETAIDCAGWCELATIGDSYNQAFFDVYIED